MAQRSLVPVLRVRDAFHARVVAARLGSEGILCQVRGADGPYPTGWVEVLVLSDELDSARELLLADEVESAFDDAALEGDGDGDRSGASGWLLLAAVALLACAFLVSAVAAGAAGAR